MSWFKRRAPALPAVPNRLTKAELQAMLDGPNGRAILTELRKGQIAHSEQFTQSIQDCEQYLRFLSSMKANADGTAKDIESMLSEVQA